MLLIVKRGMMTVLALTDSEVDVRRLQAFFSARVSNSQRVIESISMTSVADPLGRDFLFCKFCGTMLRMELRHVVCPLCKFKKNVHDVADREISYTVTAEEIKIELGISLFEQPQGDKGGSQLSKVKRACEKCQNPEMYYSTRQTRSADEGQTTYYICPKCSYRCQES